MMDEINVEALDMDALWAIAEESPFLGAVEQALRNGGQAGIADRVVKFQQDAGVKLDVEMTGVPLDAEMPGLESARLRRNYEEVTRKRMNTLLCDVKGHLPATMQDAFGAFCKKLGTDDDQSPPVSCVKPAGKSGLCI